MAAILAFNAGKTVAQIAAIQVTVDHLFDIRPPEAIFPGGMFIVFPYQFFKIVLYAVIIIRVLRVAWPVFGCRQ